MLPGTLIFVFTAHWEQRLFGKYFRDDLFKGSLFIPGFHFEIIVFPLPVLELYFLSEAWRGMEILPDKEASNLISPPPPPARRAGCDLPVIGMGIRRGPASRKIMSTAAGTSRATEERRERETEKRSSRLQERRWAAEAAVQGNYRAQQKDAVPSVRENCNFWRLLVALSSSRGWHLTQGGIHATSPALLRFLFRCIVTEGKVL